MSSGIYWGGSRVSTWQQPDSSWWDVVPWEINDAAGQMPGGGASGAGANGKFSMSKSEMEAVLKEATTLRDLIDEQLYRADALKLVKPPAQDPASVRYTEAALSTGNFYLGHLQLQSKYLGGLIGNLKKALGITTEQDENNADVAKKAGTLG
ncbi:hypothetical protein [Amycolatopsis suaedae]|uniref:PE domain-containing protein n=1 Tax=Amycolatopsis suaedae TaxID=2510978 RepID=A0A4V2ELJ2_9PSEU|nr:hypothetical protein [Amycolatopsis suaedae]RZQ61755.1 hypothetical protein EWH70_22660 [Amycolatopsis suaedae]